MKQLPRIAGLGEGGESKPNGEGLQPEMKDEFLSCYILPKIFSFHKRYNHKNYLFVFNQ